MRKVGVESLEGEGLLLEVSTSFLDSGSGPGPGRREKVNKTQWYLW